MSRESGPQPAANEREHSHSAAPNADPWWGILKSTNGGLTWTQVLTDGSRQYISVSPGFASDGTAFASLGYYHGALGIWKTTDGSDTWAPVNNDLQTGVQCLGPNPWYVPAVYATPDLEFWAVAKNAPSSTPCYLYRSRDYGQTWQSVPVLEATGRAYPPVMKH